MVLEPLRTVLHHMKPGVCVSACVVCVWGGECVCGVCVCACVCVRECVCGVCVCVSACVVCVCVVRVCSLAIAIHLTVSSSVCPYSLGRVQYSVMARTNLTVAVTVAQAVGLIPVGGREFLEASP